MVRSLTHLFSKFSKKIPWVTKRAKYDGRDALFQFLQNLHQGKNLSITQSKANIQEGIVELIDKKSKRHRSNGILITKNGFFLTCYHCLGGGRVANRSVRLHNGKIYPVEYLGGYDAKRDIAIGKIDLCRTTDPIIYKFADMDMDRVTASRRKPVVLLTRENGRIAIRGGYLTGFKKKILINYNGGEKIFLKDQIALELYAYSGDSGGVMVGMHGEIIGILNTGTGFKKLPHSSCSFISHILETVGDYLPDY